ncbi:MAG: cation:proton antiporter [Eubacteriales bacterium]|nr:cation:proton antiporter [Eubacteriales bacterium]
MNNLIILSVAMIAGLLMSRIAKKVGLPAVTSYLVAGLLLGPFFIGRLNIIGIGFNTLKEVKDFSILSNLALGFIAFTIGNEFRLSEVKNMGKKAVVVGIGQAVGTTILVDIVLICLSYFNNEFLSLESAIVLGAIASATAPAATLLVVKQYKADGPLTKLLLLVVAIDDAVGLVLFSLSFGIAKTIESGTLNFLSIFVEPIVEIFFSIALGAIVGIILTYIEKLFHSGSKRVSISISLVMMMVGIANMSFNIFDLNVSFSLLLVCMVAGTVFCNMCDFSLDIMERIDGWSAPIFILFFVLSGAELDLNVFQNSIVFFVGLMYFISRAIGKYYGSFLTCKITNCSKQISDNLGLTLLPQAGVALGMAQSASFLKGGVLISNIVLFSVLISELIAPVLTKQVLIRAGEIKIQNRKSSRVENVPTNKEYKV